MYVQARVGADQGGLLAASLGVRQQAAPPQYGAHIAMLLRCLPLHLLPPFDLHTSRLGLASLCCVNRIHQLRAQP